MIPVDQTILDDDNGDCFMACLASILEIPLLEAPEAAKKNKPDEVINWWEPINDWLQSRNLKLMEITFPDPQILNRCHFEGTDYCIMTGISPRRRQDNGNIKYHAVIAEVKGNVTIAHDPHPSRDGLQNWGYRWLRFIVKT